MINLPDYIKESNIEYIQHRLKDIASISLKKILNKHYTELGIKYKKDIKNLLEILNFLNLKKFCCLKIFQLIISKWKLKVINSSNFFL